MSQAQPFAGIRVIEFGQFMAVPLLRAWILLRKHGVA